MKYIIVVEYMHITEYIGQGTYRCGGERYVVLTDHTHAKRYSTYRRAESAYKRLVESCVNIGFGIDSYMIEEVDE